MCVCVCVRDHMNICIVLISLRHLSKNYWKLFICIITVFLLVETQYNTRRNATGLVWDFSLSPLAITWICLIPSSTFLSQLSIDRAGIGWASITNGLPWEQACKWLKENSDIYNITVCINIICIYYKMCLTTKKCLLRY